jgi:peptidoglycan/LPS O-acetylase OafA/YrhL
MQRYFPQTSEYSLENALHKDANNFNIIRLFASATVIFGHAYALVPVRTLPDPISHLLKIDYSGALAVKLFFFLSGLLVTNSLLKDRRPIAFLIKRAMRIFPALIVCIFLTVFVLGPVFTTLPLSAYFSEPATWAYMIGNATLYDIRWTLPGVFENSPVGVNGSLWTLPKEWLCYATFAVAGALGLLSRRRIAIFCALVIIALSVFIPTTIPRFRYDSEAHLLPAAFALGALCALNQKTLMIHWSYCVLLWMVFAFESLFRIDKELFYVALFYSALVVATARSVRRFAALPFDASYGVYLFGFPIQQALYATIPGMGVYANQAVSISCALALGVLSWFCVERPAIALGRAWTRKKAPSWQVALDPAEDADATDLRLDIAK